MRDDDGAADGQRGGIGVLDARIAFGAVVVVGADDNARPRVVLVQRLGDRHQVASVESHGDGLIDGVMHRGGGGVALGHEQNRVRRATDQVKMAFLSQASRPEILVAAVFLD